MKPFDRLNPSAENLAKFFFDEIQKELKAPVAYVRVWETDTSFAVYRP
ncbi:MAG: 6-carboxytetrahydropterin synthase [Bryobacteraceae bacterium]